MNILSDYLDFFKFLNLFLFENWFKIYSLLFLIILMLISKFNYYKNFGRYVSPFIMATYSIACYVYGGDFWGLIQIAIFFPAALYHYFLLKKYFK